MQTLSHYWVNKDERATLAQQHLQNVRANYAIPQDRSMNLMHFQNCFGGLT